MVKAARPAARKPSPLELSILMAWHGLLSGGFLVAYLTGEASYAMHVFSGLMVLAAIALRLIVGLAAAKGSPLRLPRLNTGGWGAWGLAPFDFQKMRRAINGAMAVAMLTLISLAALSGWAAHDLGLDDDLHEGLAEATPALIFVHIAIAVTFHALRSSPSVPASRGAPELVNKVTIP